MPGAKGAFALTTANATDALKIASKGTRKPSYSPMSFCIKCGPCNRPCHSQAFTEAQEKWGNLGIKTTARALRLRSIRSLGSTPYVGFNWSDAQRKKKKKANRWLRAQIQWPGRGVICLSHAFVLYCVFCLFKIRMRPAMGTR